MNIKLCLTYDIHLIFISQKNMRTLFNLALDHKTIPKELKDRSEFSSMHVKLLKKKQSLMKFFIFLCSFSSCEFKRIRKILMTDTLNRKIADSNKSREQENNSPLLKRNGAYKNY